VMEIQNRYQQPLQQAQSQEQAQQVQQQAMQELNEVVQRHGLTIEEFNQIGQAASTDPAIMQQIEKELGSQP
jgi:GTP1/Obg family GTP-binding protein